MGLSIVSPAKTSERVKLIWVVMGSCWQAPTWDVHPALQVECC
jgi:hypothetical protein